MTGDLAIGGSPYPRVGRKATKAATSPSLPATSPSLPLPVPFPGLTKLNVAFFNVNGALSIGLFLFTLGDLLLG